jgi:hypothetical protein
MDVDDDKADLLRKEMDVLMGAVNKHYGNSYSSTSF